jgi:carbon-monoxide dehydrogenase large subunit
LREKLERIAAHLLGSHAQYISISQGLATAADNGRSMTIADIADTVYSQMGKVPKDVIEVLEETQSYDPVWGTTSASTHIAMVEIDPETYMVHVTDYLVADDCGRVINPMIVEGQAHGAVAQGIGAALLEEVIYDERGQLLTASLVDYVAPSAPEVPATRVVHVMSALPATIGGFRGMGEGGTIGSPAAIANAVSDALVPLGIEIQELPVTPERLFQLIEKRKSNTKEM